MSTSSSQLVCIKRPEPGLSSLFEEMYVNERLVDVTLSCADGQLQAHKLVLAACSQYFSGIFDKLPNQFHFPIVVLQEMKIDDLRLILDFMYRGQLTLSQEKLSSLMKSAEFLRISGLSSNSTDNVSEVSRDSLNYKPLAYKVKKLKKQSFNSNLPLVRSYNPRQNELDPRLSPQTNKLLEQSMSTGDSLDSSHQFSYASHDPISTRNLNSHQMQNSNVTAGHHLASSLDQPNEQLSNQLQVLSHSLAANRTSLVQHMSAGAQQASGHQSNPQNQLQQQPRGRVHPCNICWKTFREKANLKRHLQVHSIDRVVYACPDCNKTFSWKDNYIRHTKTTHHMSNVRTPQT